MGLSLGMKLDEEDLKQLQMVKKKKEAETETELRREELTAN